jgi:hypothetical protein
MAGISEHDRDTLRRIEHELRSQDPKLVDQFARLGRPFGARRPLRRRFGWGTTAITLAALLAVTSVLIAFVR